LLHSGLRECRAAVKRTNAATTKETTNGIIWRSLFNV
jgi:hypothetical protein